MEMEKEQSLAFDTVPGCWGTQGLVSPFGRHGQDCARGCEGLVHPSAAACREARKVSLRISIRG